jgi:hypothetical protein
LKPKGQRKKKVLMDHLSAVIHAATIVMGQPGKKQLILQEHLSEIFNDVKGVLNYKKKRKV